MKNEIMKPKTNIVLDTHMVCGHWQQLAPIGW